MLARQIITKGLLLRNAGAVSRSYQTCDHKPSTMNDLPLPEGDWQENHNRKNTTYNSILVAGIMALGGTILFVKGTGVLHFNFHPPKSID